MYRVIFLYPTGKAAAKTLYAASMSLIVRKANRILRYIWESYDQPMTVTIALRGEGAKGIEWKVCETHTLNPQEVLQEVQPLSRRGRPHRM